VRKGRAAFGRPLLALSVALLSLSCERGRSTVEEPAAKNKGTTSEPGAPAKAVKPPPPPTIPGPVIPHGGEAHGQSSTPKPSLKNLGVIGDELEGDVYRFKLVSFKKCGPELDGAAPSAPTTGPRARVAYGAEVEITALREMNASPKDVSIGDGAVGFNGSVDRKRKLEGCQPLLKLGPMKAKDVAKGFAILDVPVTGPGSDLSKMTLAYQPTRWGGSGQVRVTQLVAKEPARTASR
jgi:hypothetical protein